MTREELKRHCLKQIEGCEMWARHNGGEPHGKVYEEHKLILELLEQEPCSDAISRQAVNTLIDELARAISDERCCISRGRSTATIMRDILHLPPVTPKTGHWMIDEDSTDWFFATYECSCCKRAIIVPHDAMKAVYKDYPYCHCGAKMQEVEE